MLPRDTDEKGENILHYVTFNVVYFKNKHVKNGAKTSLSTSKFT